jgi:hypothetical protein
MFTGDGIIGCRDSHSWAMENPNETDEAYFICIAL